MEIRPDVPAKTNKARKLTEEEVYARLVNQPEFLDHLNQVVFKPIFGFEISRDAAKNVVDGIANQIAYICLSGGQVRLGDLGTFSACVSEGANSKVPSAGEEEEPRRVARLSFRSSANTKRLVKQAMLKEESKTIDD